MAARNITSPIAIFDPCTHEKKFFTPSTKKVVPMCGRNSTVHRFRSLSPPCNNPYLMPSFRAETEKKKKEEKERRRGGRKKKKKSEKMTEN